MKSRILILTLACAAFILDGATAFAQSDGDFRTRSNASGTPDWDANNLWQIYDSGWGNTTSYPAVNTAAVTVRSGPDVQVNVTDAAAATLTIDTGGDVTILSTSVLEVAGDVSIDDADGLQVTGELLITANSTFSDPSGSNGSVQLMDNDAVIRIRDSGETFTVASSITVHGAGQIIGSGNYTNNGVLDADVSGTLLVNISGTLGDSAGDRWRATTSGSAVLEFGAALDDNTTSISIAGDFTISDSAEIQIDEMSRLTSPFTTTGLLTLSAGTFDAQESVTMGQDGLDPKHLNQTGGSIVVAAGMTFMHN